MIELKVETFISNCRVFPARLDEWWRNYSTFYKWSPSYTRWAILEKPARLCLVLKILN